MAKNEAKIKFTAETGKFNDAIKKSNDELSELRAEFKLNEAQMQNTGKTVEGLEKKHENLENQLKASHDKTEALSQKVEKAVEIFGENSVEVSKLKTQLANAQTAEEKLKTAVSNCENEIRAQAAAAEEAARAEKAAESATAKLTAEISEQENELQQLKGEYVKTVLEQGKGSKSAKELANKIDGLSSELNENKKKLNKAETAADKLDNSLKTLDDTARETSDGFTVMKGAMANLVADGIKAAGGALVGLGTEAFTAANDIVKATNTYITQTGASADAAGEFEDVLTSIYNNNFGESFEDIAASMATVKNNMGDIDNGELQKLTEGAILLRDTFEFEVGESTRAASMLMKQYGIDANKAYSLIATGAQNGLNKNGDLMDIINEYSVHFSQLGISADDMFNMLASSAETGVFSIDKVGDALKEFGIRAKDGSDSSRAAFEYLGYDADELFRVFNEGGEEAAIMTKAIMDELAGMPDGVEKTTAGVALFGTMWEDLGDDAIGALAGFDTVIDTTKNSLEEINKQKYNDLGSALEGIKRNLTTSVAEPINENVLPVLNDFVGAVDWQGMGQMAGEAMGVIVKGMLSLVDGTMQAVSWMKEHKGVMATVATVIGVLVTAIGAYNIAQGIKTAMDAAQVTTIWGLVAAHWAQATAAMAAMAPYILVVAAIAAVIAIIVVCIKYWDNIVEAVKNCWDAVVGVLSQWGDWINQNVIQPIVNFFKGLWDGIVNIFKSVIDWVKNNWQAIVLFMINPFAGIFKYLYDNFEGFRNVVNNVVTAIKDFFVNLWNNIVSAYHTVIDPWIEIIKRAAALAYETIILPIKNFFVDLWNSIVSGLQAAWNWCVSIASAVAGWVNANVIQPVTNFFVGLWNKIKSGASTAWNGIKSVFSTISNWVNSKVVEPVKNAFSNAWNAVKNGASNAWNGIKSVFSKVASFFGDIFSKAWQKVKSVFSAGGKIFDGIKDGIVNAFKTVVNAIIRGINKVVSIPFNGLNKILGKLAGLDILGVSPFSWLTWRASVPQIPLLAQGGYVAANSPQLAIVGDNRHEGEIIAPESKIAEAVERGVRAVNLEALAAAVEDLASRPLALNINGRQFALATAGDTDNISGMRTRFKERGLILD